VSAVFVKLPVFFRFFVLDGRSLAVQRFLGIASQQGDQPGALRPCGTDVPHVAGEPA
jgi:hypothetical protein